MYYLTGDISFSNDSCFSGVGEGYFYNEWEAIVSCRVPPVPMESFIPKLYHEATITFLLHYINII